jgi:hypothetical protein
LEELLSDESGWPIVQSWVAAATNDVRVLPVDREHGERTLRLLQVTTRAPLGAIALETGGMLGDHGWLRLLGAGGGELRSGLTSWNGFDANPQGRPLEGALLVAHDAVGGFFAINGGAFDGEQGRVFYFAPDTLGWQDTEMDYSGFLQWLCAGDLARFYEDLRWPAWEVEVSAASPEKGFHLYPPPFSDQGQPVEGAQRRLVPMIELWDWYQEFARQLAALPEGEEFRVRFAE